ncbi:hypothetical protein B0H19DRAFT_1380009 [Mycena capillaripes]|nr:hypothetical protein B0H19DRAFT_1380009 [Mycena capillaripes]
MLVDYRGHVLKDVANSVNPFISETCNLPVPANQVWNMTGFDADETIFIIESQVPVPFNPEAPGPFALGLDGIDIGQKPDQGKNAVITVTGAAHFQLNCVNSTAASVIQTDSGLAPSLTAWPQEGSMTATPVANYKPAVLIPSPNQRAEHPICLPSPRLFVPLREGYELRVLRIVVQERLRLLTELATAAELSQVFHDISKCYGWLFEKANILHRDISRNNLMYRRIDGKVYGVLNDFDLSVLMGKEARTHSI